ncbi:hypothetical protein GWE18_11765 [Bradyrhizobium sp. CSA112]|uniref:hypothetical protein n=1 Tax=Bradyrhizobium sp. CSA112 TaxID=2699170 RepID=UPI0023B16251|nr:hypothetical protein [Bradyrhizobium sp. CSA112]MDE5453533.1 hypothetical protein [Bradyrhizobium sp. CSA112]
MSMIGGDNAALSTDSILAGSEGIVRRDIAAFASADSRAASAALGIAERALVSNGLARHRQVAAAGLLFPAKAVDPKLGYVAFNRM